MLQSVIMVIPNRVNQQEKSYNKYIGGVVFWVIIGIIIYRRWKKKSNKKL